jgi:hypothetical protein
MMSDRLISRQMSQATQLAALDSTKLLTRLMVRIKYPLFVLIHPRFKRLAGKCISAGIKTMDWP